MNQIFQFAKEYTKWVRSGKDVRPPEEIDRLFEICSACPNSELIEDGDVRMCNLCNCRLAPSSDDNKRNKLLWATTRCPMEPPMFIEHGTSKDEENSNPPCCG